MVLTEMRERRGQEVREDGQVRGGLDEGEDKVEDRTGRGPGRRALVYHRIRSSHEAAMSRGLRERQEEGEEKGYA